MKWILRGLVLVLAAGLLWWGLEMLAAESGEVVVVTTYDASGEPRETRLWVVDHEGRAWLRSGSDMATWFQRLSANPDVMVERNGVVVTYRAVPRIDAREEVNARMLEKYGWADRWIGFWFDRSDAIPIRLDPGAPPH